MVSSTASYITMQQYLANSTTIISYRYLSSITSLVLYKIICYNRSGSPNISWRISHQQCAHTLVLSCNCPQVIRFLRTKKALVTVPATSRSQLDYHLYTMFDTLCSGLWLHPQLYHRCSYLLPLQLPAYLPSCFSCMLWTLYGIFYDDILQLMNSKLHTCIDVYSKVMTFALSAAHCMTNRLGRWLVRLWMGEGWEDNHLSSVDPLITMHLFMENS